MSSSSNKVNQGPQLTGLVSDAVRADGNIARGALRQLRQTSGRASSR